MLSKAVLSGLMQSMFQGKRKVVVEIGNDWLKILECVYSKGNSCINNISFTKMAQIKEPVSEAIEKIFRQMKLSRDSVLTYVPRHLATVRFLELPSTDPDEIREIVNLQVSKQTPYTKEEILFDHKIVGSVRPGYTKAVLVIARRNIISERIKALQKAGISIERMTVSSECIYNWFDMGIMPDLDIEDAKEILLIDIDSNYSDFIIISNKKFAFTRNILIGANHLLNESEDWKGKFIEEVRHSMELYDSKEADVKVKKIFLSGATIGIKGLDDLLAAALDKSVRVIDPVKNTRVKINKGVDMLENENLKFVSISPLLGATLKHRELAFDLMPAELKIQKLMEGKRKYLSIMGVLIVSIAMMASLLLLTYIYNRNFYLQQLNDRITKIKADSMDVEKMRLRIALVEKQLSAERASINILNEIIVLLPDSIYLTSISIDEGKEAVLRGRAFAMSYVFKFLTTLEGSPYFENVKTTFTSTKKENDIETAEFEIICGIENNSISKGE